MDSERGLWTARGAYGRREGLMDSERGLWTARGKRGLCTARGQQEGPVYSEGGLCTAREACVQREGPVYGERGLCTSRGNKYLFWSGFVSMPEEARRGPKKLRIILSNQRELRTRAEK